VNSLLKVTGTDALDFLQGQLTQDIDRISRQASLPAAWCNPKGRVIVTTRIIRHADGFALVLPANLGDSVLKRLQMYRFRANVEFDLAGPEWKAIAIDEREDIALIQKLELLPRSGATLTSRGIHAVRHLGDDDFVELYAEGSAMEAAGLTLRNPMSDDAWCRARIRAGIPVIDAGNTEKFTPHMLNLDLLGAISFRKGCYTGQEIVARTENLGRSRRRLFVYEADAEGISSGDKLSADGKDIAEVVNVAGRDLLALAPVDTRDQALRCGDIRVEPRNLPYAV